jgi:hypothetical protein
MNVKSIRWWMRYLVLNKEFFTYCRAKRSHNEGRCEALETKFELLPDLYADFGDIYAAEIFKDKDKWLAWLDTRRHLFMERRPVVRLVADQLEYKRKPASLLVEIPLCEKKADSMAAVKRFLDFYYDGEPGQTPEEVRKSRPGFSELRPPKYRLCSGAKNLSAASIGTLRKARYVEEVRRRRWMAGEAASHTDLVLAIKQDAKNPFGWTLSEQDKKDVDKGVFKKALYGSSEITTVKRALKDYSAYVRNTIHGRFPDNS